MLDKSFRVAWKKITGAERTPWDVLIGPVGAMIASASRIVWNFVDSCTFTDDPGQVVSLKLNPLAAVCRHV